MTAEENGDPPVPDLRTMEELCQPYLNGRGGPIASIAIQETNFGLKNDMIQQVHNSCQFHGLLGDDANKHLDKFLHVTQSIKVNGVIDDALRLYLFPHSLTHHATAWFDRFPRNSINTFEQMAKMFLGKYFSPFMVTKLRNEITNFRQRPDESLFKAWERYKLSIDQYLHHNMLLVTQIDTFYNGLTLRHRDTINAAAGGTFMKKRPEKCYDQIENMTAHHNDWDTSAQRSESSSSITSSSDQEIVSLKAEMAKINKNLIKVLQVNQQVKSVTPSCETCGGSHSYNDCPATVGQTHNVHAAGAYQGGNSYQPQVHEEEYRFILGLGTLPSNTITNPKEDLKGITTRSGTAYQGPMIPTSFSSLPKVVEHETEPSLAKPKMYMLREPIKVGNNQGRNQFFQGASHGQNPPPAYQAPGYQAPVHQPPIHQHQVLTTTEFTNYMKANDAILKNMQTNMTSLTNSNLELKNMFGQFMKMNTASSSGLRTLPVEHETEVTKDTVPPANNGSTKDVQPLIVQTETLILNSKHVVSPIIEPVVAPANDQKDKFFQIFQDLNFNISFVDALILMPKFGPTIKVLLTNKDKLSELARTPLNEHCSAILLKKLPEKLGDPSKFLIPCDFSRMDECLALADLDTSINLMPLLVWNKLSLLELSLTYMTLKLSDRSISRPVGVAKYVFVKVGTFPFSSDFVVVDFDADPRVPLILERSFLMTGRALIDVFERELTLRVGKEAITFNLDQTSRYSANYNVMTANRINVIDMACEEYSQEILGFSDEVDAFLALEDDLTSPEVDHSYFDTDGDILLLEAFLNDDPSLPYPNQVELKDLPHHLEYAFLEGDDKLPVIIAKDLSDEEKTALITVLKSHKRAIA
nr:reverse transcriptase domain-containing protein [Tanacetum cinerariifolium]